MLFLLSNAHIPFFFEKFFLLNIICESKAKGLLLFFCFFDIYSPYSPLKHLLFFLRDAFTESISYHLLQKKLQTVQVTAASSQFGWFVGWFVLVTVDNSFFFSQSIVILLVSVLQKTKQDLRKSIKIMFFILKPLFIVSLQFRKGAQIIHPLIFLHPL